MRVRNFIYTSGLAALCLIIASSCGRDTPLTPYVPDDSGDFKYKINGLKDTSLERIGDVRYLVFVEKVSGKAETVVLSAEDLPKGMDVTFDPVNSVAASFNTTMVIKATRVKEGTYTINIRGASATTGISNNPVKVTILPYTNPAIGLKGGFTETGQCTQKGSVNDNVNIIADDTIKNRIYIKGLFSGVMTNIVYADIDPLTQTLVIPKQTVNSVSYQGDGSYDDDKLIINYTIAGITINESCTSTLTRN